MTIEVGTLMRRTIDPRDIWKVTKTTAKTVWMARCDERGNFGSYGPSLWMFRLASVQRDFHPA